MASVSRGVQWGSLLQSGAWGGQLQGSAPGSYDSPKQHLLQQYEQQGSVVVLGSTVANGSGGAGSAGASSSGDCQLNAQEIITSPRSTYQVLELLGRGTFGQVLRCWKKDSNEVVAMKILKNLPSYAKQGEVEVDVLATLSKVDSEQFNFVHAYESFTHHGHICIVFECLQINLYDYLKRNRFQPLPLKHIRPMAQQVLTCLKKLGELGLVHADLKPENIMLVDPDRQPFRVKVIDFGSATCRSTELSTSYLQSRYYRAPEVILGMAYDEAIDMWSLGCVLAELFLGWPLFPGATEYDQITYISQMLGEPPQQLTKNVTKMSKFYRRDNQGKWVLKTPAQFQLVNLKEARKFIFTSVAAIGQVPNANCHGNNDMSQDAAVAQHQDKQQFISLLEMLLTFDPRKRADTECCLHHPFVTMLHLSMQTNSPCVREWIECMQVCCQSRTTTSSPRNVTATATPTNFTAPATPTVFSTVYPQLLYTVGSAAYLPGHALPSLVPLPSYWDYRSPLVATQQSLLVDAGYASAQSSPTATAAVHSLMDCPKVELLNSPHYSPGTLNSPHYSPGILNSSYSSYWFMLQQAGYFT